MNNDGMMTIEDYKALYDHVVEMSMDADNYGLFKHISDEDVEKCKWIYLINECLQDVPMGRVRHIFKQKKIKFDVIEFLEENDM